MSLFAPRRATPPPPTPEPEVVRLFQPPSVFDDMVAEGPDHPFVARFVELFMQVAHRPCEHHYSTPEECNGKCVPCEFQLMAKGIDDHRFEEVTAMSHLKHMASLWRVSSDLQVTRNQLTKAIADRERALAELAAAGSLVGEVAELKARNAALEARVARDDVSEVLEAERAELAGSVVMGLLCDGPLTAVEVAHRLSGTTGEVVETRGASRLLQAASRKGWVERAGAGKEWVLTEHAAVLLECEPGRVLEQTAFTVTDETVAS